MKYTFNTPFCKYLYQFSPIHTLNFLYIHDLQIFPLDKGDIIVDENMFSQKEVSHWIN